MSSPCQWLSSVNSLWIKALSRSFGSERILCRYSRKAAKHIQRTNIVLCLFYRFLAKCWNESFTTRFLKETSHLRYANLSEIAVLLPVSKNHRPRRISAQNTRKKICCWLKSSAGFYTNLYELIGTYRNLPINPQTVLSVPASSFLQQPIISRLPWLPATQRRRASCLQLGEAVADWWLWLVGAAVYLIIYRRKRSFTWIFF